MPPTPTRPLALLFLFVALSAAGDRGGAALLKRITRDSGFRYSRLYAGKAAADVLILGDSRGVHSFYAPALQKALGRRVLNLSYNSFSTLMLETVLADYLGHNPPPRLVVLEVTNFPRESNVLGNLKPFVGESSRVAALFRREDPRTAAAMDLLHLYRYNSESFLRILYYTYRRRDDQDWILDARAKRADLDIANDPTGVYLSGSRFERENFEAVARLLELSRRHGFEVRFVAAPYWPGFRDRVKDWGGILAYLEQHVTGGRPVWDYSLAVSDPHYFADRVHLNRDGALWFARRLEADRFFEGGATPPGQAAAPTLSAVPAPGPGPRP